MRKKLMMTLGLAAVAANSVACSLQFTSLLGVQPGSALEVQILTLPPETTPLEGGNSFDIDIEIGLFELLFGLPIDGDITVSELLIASPGFAILGVPTEEICITPDPVDPGSGTFSADLGDGTATFDVALNTIALLGNPDLAAILPGGGFAFPFSLVSEVPFGLTEMLGLLLGTGGGLEVSQPIDEDIALDVNGLIINGHIGGQINLSSVDAFPTSPLLDDCIALIGQ
jgi:hypothetical protein